MVFADLMESDKEHAKKWDSLFLSHTHKHTQSGFLSIFQAWKPEDTLTLSSSSLTHIQHILDVTYGLQPSPLCTGRSLQRCFTPTNLADGSDSGAMRRVKEWLWQMQESKKEHKLAGNLLSIDRKQENKPNVPASDVFPFIVYIRGCYSFSLFHLLHLSSSSCTGKLTDPLPFIHLISKQTFWKCWTFSALYF